MRVPLDVLGTQIAACMNAAEGTATPAEMEVAELVLIANRIRARIRRSSADIIAIGKDLMLVQGRLDQEQFATWIETELGPTVRWAQLQMQVARFAQGRDEIISLLPPTTLYRLSAESTPASIKTEVIADLQAGRAVDHRAVEERIRNERAAARHRALLAPRPRRRTAKSPAAQKRQAAKERREAEQVAERERQIDAAAAEAMTIFEKLESADIQRLRELLGAFGPYVVTQRLRIE